MTANSQTTFSNALAYMYEKFSVTYFWFEFHWHLFLMVQVNIGSGNVLAPNRRQLKSHYLNECGPNMLTRMCGTKGSWVNHVYESLAAVCHQLTGPRSLLRYPLVRDYRHFRVQFSWYTLEYECHGCSETLRPEHMAIVLQTTIWNALFNESI